MSSQVQVSGAAEADTGEDQMVIPLPRVSRNLHSTELVKAAGDGSFLDALLKVDDRPESTSSQGVAVGRKSHPFNFDTVTRFQTANVHHGRAIHAKVAATVGLGFQTPNDKKRKDHKQNPMGAEGAGDMPPEGDLAVIDERLNPLCEHSWQDTLHDVCEDYWQTGNGYLEVVRGEGGEILGLHHLTAKETWVVIEDHRYNRHYSVQSSEDSAGVRLFAKFGDLDDFLARQAGGQIRFEGPYESLSAANTSEVIHFRRPTSLSRWYGFPDWLAAVASIELVQCLTQHEYDFFLNRGVPEFMLFIIGQQLHAKDKDRIEAAMRSTIGLSNQHKSLLVNLPAAGDALKVQLEKLAIESKSDGSQFAGMAESLALQIVTAHGVPPLLAGIQIPGKLGASNEMVQAMQAFQTLVIGPTQRLFRQTLANTLGKDPGLGLTQADLVLNTITDEIDVQKADTMARMRQSPQEAEAEGRDMEDGVKKDDLTEEERGALVREAIDFLIDRLAQRAA